MLMNSAFIAVALILQLLSLELVSSQQVVGVWTFLSLDCGLVGGLPSYPDQSVSALTWQQDQNFISTGSAGALTGVDTAAVPKQLQSVRFFPAGSSPTKNCFVLPVKSSRNQYFVRAGFLYGNYDGLQSPSIDFQIAVDSTPWEDVTVSGTSTSALYYEIVLPATTTATVSVCLIRTGSASPFINSLELREISFLSYPRSAQTYLRLVSRVNFGANTTLRYPDDTHDRIWPPDSEVLPIVGGIPISAPAGRPVDNMRNMSDAIPSAVLATAVSGPVLSFSRVIPANTNFYTFAYYAEVNASTTPADRRYMTYSDNFKAVYNAFFELPFVGYGYGYKVLSSRESTSFVVTLTRNVSSTLDALVCADELYIIQPGVNGTHPDDVAGLSNLISVYNLTQWVGDPCKPAPWDELTCADDATNGDLSRVTSLNLSGKKLRGTIPSNIITPLPFLKNLNLSDNNFAGAIPSGLKTLQFLKVLDLANNNLTGGLDVWMLSLTTLDVSNNQLDRTFPSSLLSLPTFRYTGNPLLQCVQVNGTACRSQPPPPGAPPPSIPSPESHGGSSIAPIVGGIAGALVIGAILAGVIIWYKMCRKPRALVHGGGRASSGGSVVLGKETALSFTREAIRIATRNYAEQIGEGGFGPVYHGELSNPKQQEVAVKILSGKSKQGWAEFFNEIVLLSTIHHRNLVALVGYCHDPPDFILLYEYMAGGDLRQRLYGATCSPALSWLQRLNIALDSAKGLQYLHDGCKQGIIHRDVKTSNILLTRKMEAKLADFGLSKLKGEGDNLMTKVQGTVGYLDPEYNSSGLLTEMSDIYSFGVVLMEILTGQPVNAPDGAHERYIVHRVENAVKAGTVDRVVDRAVGSGYSAESAWILAEIAIGCTRPSGSARPNIGRVVTELTKAVEKEQLNTLSFSSSSQFYSGSSTDRTDITFRHPDQPRAR